MFSGACTEGMPMERKRIPHEFQEYGRDQWRNVNAKEQEADSSSAEIAGICPGILVQNCQPCRRSSVMNSDTRFRPAVSRPSENIHISQRKT